MTTTQTINPAFDVDPFAAPVPSARQGGECCRYTGVIDVGSGSARAVVMQVNSGGGIEIVAQQRVNLNLMSHVDADGVLDAVGVRSTLDALEDFALVARGYGIETVHAVGTAALRESGNAEAIIAAAEQRFGLTLRIIDGTDEAAYCFIGAIHGLRVTDGMLADIGGGSTELVRFTDRTLGEKVSLPLGSLRIANRFGLTDRPRPEDVQAAYDHVCNVLSRGGVPKMPAGGALVGSGGSVRLLSRLRRHREMYPIIKMHGFQIDADALAEQVYILAALSRQERDAIPEMNLERSHSIVGGAVVAHALVSHMAADGILVSGQGLREGLARHPAPLQECEEIRLPDLETVRQESLADLEARFAPQFSQRGRRRAALAARIARVAWRGQRQQITGSLECAALLVDLGNAVDFYNRLNRAASIIVRTDLPGFTHRESAQVAAILLEAEAGQLPRRFRESRLFPGDDATLVRQAAAILLVADELERRLPPDCNDSVVQIGRQSGKLTLTTPWWSAVAGPGIREKWLKTRGEDIRIGRSET